MSLPTLGEVIYGMKRLISSDHQAKSDVSHKTDPKAVLDLDFLLRNNLEAFDEALINDGKLVNLSRWWREVVLFETGGVSSVRRRFVTYCLKLLHCLHRTIQRCQSEQEAARTDRQDGSGTGQCNSLNLAAPALGVQDQKTLKSVLQFIVCLGISPYLQTGVGIPLHMRSGFSAIVGKEADLPYTDASCLPSCLKVLLQCTDMSSLATVILSQHLTDLLAGLLQVLHTKQCEKRGDKAKYDMRPESEVQVSHEDTKNIKSGSVTVEAVEISEKCEDLSMKTVHDGSSVSKWSTTETLDSDERNESVEMPDLDAEYCRKSLQNLFNRVYPPLLVKTLLLLQGGPKLKRPASNKVPVLPPAPVWMRHVLNQQLATIMMKPKGIQYVLRGMMDGPGASTGVNTGTADWKRCDAVARVITCCPLQYVTLGDFYTAIGPQIRDLLHLEDKQMCQQYIRIAWSAISSMAQQDLALTKQHVISPILQPLISCTTDNQDVSHSSIHVTEASLSCCIEDCYKVFVCGCTDNPSLITCLQEIILPVYDLLVFIKPGVSALKKQCHEIVVSFLKQVENDAGINFLEFMAFQESAQDARLDLPIMHPDLVFQHGPNGGVQVVVTRGDGKEGSDDEKTRVECIVSILKDLESSGLAGEFFVHMLKELTQVIQSEVSPSGLGEEEGLMSDRSDRSLLLDKEQEETMRVKQFYRKITLLNMLACVCEELGPDCIKNATHALEFVKATLERGVQVCKSTCDVMLEVFESETLSMAMGLLTATLTGAYQLTEENRVFMKELLPLLQEISSNHPETSVQEMATDIRVAIATHGAVWSEKSKSKAFSGVGKIGKESRKANASRTNATHLEGPHKPKIEVLHESCNSDINHSSVNDLDAFDTGANLRKYDYQDDKDRMVVIDDQKTKTNTCTEHTGNQLGVIEQKTKINSCTENTENQLRVSDQNTKNNSCTENTENQLRVSDQKTKNNSCTEKTGNQIDVDDEYSSRKGSSEVKEELSVGVVDNIDNNNCSHDTISNEIEKDAPIEVTEKPESELDKVYEELCDALLPVRGHGLIRLTRMIQRRDVEILNRQEAVLTIFLENLDHDDSYMYLASVSGLTALSDLCPELVVPKLCEMFANFDLLSKVGAERKVELRMKIGEVLVKASRCLGDTIPRYRDVLVQSFLVGTKDSDPFVRASSLSNVGEICKLLRFSLGNIIQEVCACCNGLLRYDPDTVVRKAAGQALTLLLQGMAGGSFKVLEGVIQDLYRTLKHCMATEREEGVKVHVTLALNELDEIMRKQLFPSQKLEKRIRVTEFD